MAYRWACVLLALVLYIFGSFHAQARSACLIQVANAPATYVDSVSSNVVVQTARGNRVNAYPDMLLCPGDVIRTGSTGRVSIRFDGKRTVVRLDGNSQAKISASDISKADITLRSGILYFLSSVKSWFRVDTPLMVAGIEGTEALVAVLPTARAAMTAVRQGVVDAYDKRLGPESTLKVSEGEAAFVSDNIRIQKAAIGALRPPFRELLIASDSAVDWAVYYPPILLARDRHNGAIRRAVILMSSGDYDRASAALNRADATDPATAAALRVIIAIGRNRLDEATFWAEKTLARNPTSAPAHIAASYNSQAHGRLEEALSFATKAAKLAPEDAYALARLAELELTVGDRVAGLKTANAALQIERIPLALFVSGLAKLVASDYEAAKQDFSEANEIDSEAPLPRLGLGLTYIRQGDLESGAWEIERALAHDPRRAFLRTWLGRAYFDEGEANKAADAFRQSKDEDPEDPTPYFFAALERFAANSPIEALKEVIEANKRGLGRRVLRSSRGLGEDSAARGAAFGRILDTLSFEDTAVSVASLASDEDPSNPGTHRFLADVYRLKPNAGLAQTSELLRAQLLSPQSKTPVQPQLAEARLALLDTTGPARTTFAEFAPLFDSDGVRLDVSGLFGTQGTKSYETAITGLYRRASASVGYFDYETDGYHENNDLTHAVFNAVSTIAISPEFSIFGEYRDRESSSGDRRLNFDISTFDPDTRLEESRNVARLGFHFQPLRNSDLIGVYSEAHLSAMQFDRQSIPGVPIEVFPGVFVDTPPTLIDTTASTEVDGLAAELQYIRQDGRIRSVLGGAYRTDEQTLETNITVTTGPTSFDSSLPLGPFNSEYYNGYAYTYISLPSAEATIGGSYVDYQSEGGFPDQSELLPKLGLSVRLGDHVQIRAAYLKSLSGNLVTEQTIEPTQVAGFSQFYDAFDGSFLEQSGVGVDIKPSSRLWFGANFVNRSWDIPLNDDVFLQTEEQETRAYLYVALTDQLAVAAEWRKEETSSDVPFDFKDWKTESIPLTLSYFGKSRFFASATIEFVDHSVVDFGVANQSDFTTVSATLGYRFPNSRGVVSVEVLNATDQEIKFQNRDIRLDITEKPRYATERTVYARGALKF